MSLKIPCFTYATLQFRFRCLFGCIRCVKYACLNSLIICCIWNTCRECRLHTCRECRLHFLLCREYIDTEKKIFSGSYCQTMEFWWFLAFYIILYGLRLQAAFFMNNWKPKIIVLIYACLLFFCSWKSYFKVQKYSVGGTKW